MGEWRFESPGSLALQGVRRLSLRIAAGDVGVIGRVAEGDDASAEVEISELDGPVTIHQDGDLVSVLHERPEPGDWFDWLRFRTPRAVISIVVPSDCALELGVVSADATVAGIAAPTQVRSVSGDLTLDDVTADVRAHTVSGHLETRGLRGSLEFKSVSGDLTVVEGASPHVFAETISGELTLDLDERRSARIHLVSVSGDVTVRLPDDASLEVDLQTMSGELDSAFDGVARRRKPGRTMLSGRVGAGEGALRAKTVSGDVALLRRSSR
jgi:hypothetical protein